MMWTRAPRLRGIWPIAAVAAFVAGALLLGSPARAASLQPVSNWGASGVPSYITMYIYVPDRLATKPPILVVAHYCGGSASGVFGQAQGGGIVAAADQYGFIMILPQTTNAATSAKCWDVGSRQSLTHDGGGDTQAVAQMVKYAITTYNANADRVYATGDSSGGMMTQALLGVYPDVFKAGASFAGVPAGCWSAGWSAASNWGGTCAGGNDIMTAQQWGDLARGMYPGYTGHRPRVQLFHGDADAIISYKNFGEAIKEWTNVLALGTNPTATANGLTLGTHQATRQQWKNSCGYVVLDAFTSLGGDHGPSDALFGATYVIPFLGLDNTGPVDPEVAACSGIGGVGGTGGAIGSGGATGSGGAVGTGGATGSGDASGSGGARGTGGSTGAGATGGIAVAGGTTGSGGTSASGGRGGNGAGGASGTGVGGDTGSGGSSAGIDSGSSGCSCALGGAEPNAHPLAGVIVGLGLGLSVVLARRRRKGLGSISLTAGVFLVVGAMAGSCGGSTGGARGTGGSTSAGSGGATVSSGSGGMGGGGATATGGVSVGTGGAVATGGRTGGGGGGGGGGTTGSGGASGSGNGGNGTGGRGGAAGSGGMGGGTGATHWVGTWTASPYPVDSGNQPPAPLSNSVLRQVAHVSLGGSRIRVQFSNLSGNGSVTITSAHIALCRAAPAVDSTIDTATDKALAFSAMASVTIAQGTEIWSDPIEFTVPTLGNISITTAFGSVPSSLTGHAGSRTTSYQQTGSSAVSAASMTSAQMTDHWYYISGIDVMADASATGIVAIGDSITDGRGTDTNRNNRWTDILAARLQPNAATSNVAMMNQGIGATNLVGTSGTAAQARFNRDVLGQSGVRYAVVFDGVNDIGAGGASFASMKAAYDDLISRAHARGLQIYGGTILPFGGNTYYTPAHESVRQQVNAYIKSGVFDGFIDFDAALTDGGSPPMLQATYAAWAQMDGLHPGPAGYQRMGDSVDLALFAR